MILNIAFTVKYKTETKPLHFCCGDDDNISRKLRAELKKLYPPVKLPPLGNLHLKLSGEKLLLTATRALTVNGVSKTERLLRRGDRIALGGLRLFYESYSRSASPDEAEALPRPSSAAAKPEFRFDWKTHPLQAAAVVCFIGAASIIAGCLAIPARPKEAAPPAAQAARRPLPQVETEPESMMKPAATAEHPAPERPEDPEQSGLITIQPGGAVPAIDLDILFIHAHPDDESLDFGCLMAWAEAQGLKTGLLTLTDGESGLDLHPFRTVQEPYPDHYMEGNELADIRKYELTEAATVLGVDLLIRAGLRNHPYNSVRDELSPGKILSRWGGREQLAGMITRIIAQTTPETVVAPEKPGKAREHFEHEAVGYITSLVMESYEPDDYKAPKRYITCIDPRQHHLYPEAKALDSSIRPGSRSLREIQLSALLNHKTQNDAVNVGTGFLPKYPAEYYKIQYWRSNRSWDDIFSRKQ